MFTVKEEGAGEAEVGVVMAADRVTMTAEVTGQKAADTGIEGPGQGHDKEVGKETEEAEEILRGIEIGREMKDERGVVMGTGTAKLGIFFPKSFSLFLFLIKNWQI